MVCEFKFVRYGHTKNWERLSVATVPKDQMHLVGTVLADKKHSLGTVPLDKKHPVGTVPIDEMYPVDILIFFLTLSPTAYKILWLPVGGLRGYPMETIRGAIFYPLLQLVTC